MVYGRNDYQVILGRLLLSLISAPKMQMMSIALLPNLSSSNYHDRLSDRHHGLFLPAKSELWVRDEYMEGKMCV